MPAHTLRCDHDTGDHDTGDHDTDEHHIAEHDEKGRTDG